MKIKFTEINLRLTFITILMIMFLMALNISAQETDRDDLSTYNAVNWAYCDAALAYLDDVYEKANALNDKEKYLVIVIRLAKGERLSLYKIRRKGLDEFFKRRKLKYFIAQGNSVKEVGRAEFYVDGKLYFGLGFKMNNPKMCIGSSIG